MIVKLIKCSLISLVGVMLLSGNAKAQEGSYIALSGTGQLTKLNNSEDYARRTSILVPENTYNPAFALRYTYIYNPNYGLETGLIYSIQGQKYSGTFRDSLNFSYRSEVTMDYLRIPLKFQFNSSLGSEIKNVYMTIGTGISIDVLMNVKANTDPGYNTNGLSIDYRELYKPVSASFVADALLNIRLTDKWWIKTGINLSFGLGDVENKGFDYPDNAPLEWYFPLSTKKVKKTNVQARDRTRHSVFGVELGLAYRFGGKK